MRSNAHRATTIAVIAAITCFATGPAAASEENRGSQHAAKVGYDLLVLRPLNAVATLTSLVGAALAYPVALAFGAEDQVSEYLVQRPIDRTIRRPLGEL